MFVLHFGLFSQLLFSRVVVDELQVPFAVEQELLLFVTLLSFFLLNPLFLEHLTLNVLFLHLLISLDLAGLLLPVEHSHCVLNFLLLRSSFLHLTFEFLLSIELTKLCVNLLLHHFGLNGSSLVDELLLSLNGRAVVVELLVLLPQTVVGSLELHIKTALDFVLLLLLTLALQVLESLPHLVSDLFWCLKIVVKLLLINAVFSCQECC